MKKILTVLLVFLLAHISLIGQNRIFTPTLKLPADEAVGQMPNVVLDWDAVTGVGTDIQYELQLATLVDFSDAITFPQTDVTALEMSQLQFNSVYFWRVRAMDGFETSDWSAAWSFKVVNTVTITSPANQSNQNPDPLVKWNPVTGITHYDLEIDTAYSWAAQNSGVVTKLNEVFVVDNENTWAVGDDGVILNRSNETWITIASGTENNLFDVYFFDSNNGWAVGENGTILYYNGSEWSAQSSNVTESLNAVYFTAINNGYVVGSAGTALHFDGSSWTIIDVGISLDLLSIHGLDSEHIWIGGKTGNFSFYNGSSWSSGIVSNRDLLGLWALSPTSVWASAKAGRLYYFDGASWTEKTSGSTRDLNDICFLAENSGFAVGNNGTLLNFNGDVWQSLASGTTQNLYGIYLFDDSEGYLVGNIGVTIAFQGDGFNSPYLKAYTTSGDISEFRFSNLIFGQTHYVRMRARHETSTSDWSPARSFFVVAKPTLTKPANNAVNISLDTLAEWTALTGVVKYAIQLSTDINFSDPIYSESSTNSHRFDGLLFGQDYYWRVNARHAADISDWSDVSKFTTINAVTLLLPEDGATNVARLPRYSWQAIKGAEKYLIQHDISPDFSTKEEDVVETPYYQTMFILDDSTTYYWRVKAIQGLDSTGWSDPRSFVTLGEVGVFENTNDVFTIYPNPSKGQFQIQYSITEPCSLTIEIYNLLGSKVYFDGFNAQSGNQTAKLDLRDFENGMYLLRFSNGKQWFTKKLFIESQ